MPLMNQIVIMTVAPCDHKDCTVVGFGQTPTVAHTLMVVNDLAKQGWTIDIDNNKAFCPQHRPIAIATPDQVNGLGVNRIR